MGMKVLNTVRKVEKLRFYIGLIAVGLLFTALGGWVLLHPRDESNMMEIDVTISDMQSRIEESSSGDDETYYTVFVDYEVNGVKYEHVEYNAYDSSMKVGKVIKAKVDLTDPTHVESPDAGLIPYIITVVGVASLVFGILGLVKSAKKKVADMDEYNQVDMSQVTPEMVASVAESTEEKKDYTFHYAKFLNQSYVIEDENKNIVYDCDMKKFTLFTPYTFEFVNRLTGHRTTYQIGHEVSTSVSHGNWNIPLSKHFTIDGEENWKVLADKGLSFEMSLQGICPCYTVSRYGVPIAFLKTGGTNIVTGKSSKVGELPSNGLYYVNCRESDLDLIALVCFSIARAIFLDND